MWLLVGLSHVFALILMSSEQIHASLLLSVFGVILKQPCRPVKRSEEAAVDDDIK